jgi:hypothetical protein
MWFDESRLDDDHALATIDPVMRHLAESGPRVRRAAQESADVLGPASEQSLAQGGPRAVVAAGPDSRLLRAVLEPHCPVPFVAWPSAGLPGWAGSLDLVVVLAPQGSDALGAAAVAEAVRRGCQVVVAAPEHSLIADHAQGRWAWLLPSSTGDPLATAAVALDFLDRIGLGPRTDPEAVAAALDSVAIACAPHRDLAVNPGKSLAISLADSNPVVWGGSVLAARAARRVAESIRRAIGRSAIAGDAEHLLPILQATRPRDVFADPFAAGANERRPMLVILDDGAEDARVREQSGRLQAAAAGAGVRCEVVATDAPHEVARYASLVLTGSYAAEYLRLGLVED